MRLEEALLYYRQGHRIRIVEPRVTGSKNKNYIIFGGLGIASLSENLGILSDKWEVEFVFCGTTSMWLQDFFKFTFLKLPEDNQSDVELPKRENLPDIKCFPCFVEGSLMWAIDLMERNLVEEVEHKNARMGMTRVGQGSEDDGFFIYLYYPGTINYLPITGWEIKQSVVNCGFGLYPAF